MGKIASLFDKNNAKMSALQAYGNGKMANILFTIALSKRLKKASTYSLHPGVIKSNFGSNYTGFFKIMAGLMRPFMLSPEKGAATSIYLATSPLSEIKKYSGMFFDKSKPVSIKSEDISDSNAEMVWEKSMEIIAKM
jgi:retinol dehydrogenase 12